jgi:DNA polymerase-3 subunit alpha
MVKNPDDAEGKDTLIETVVKKDAIRFGLTTIKNFGAGIAESIIIEREKNGSFESLEDFLNRIKDKNLNKKSLESLIKAGAFDSLAGAHEDWRETLLFNLDHLLAYSKEQRNESTAQDSLFGEMPIAHSSMHLEKIVHSEHESAEKHKKDTHARELQWEKELLGLYISGHPLEQFRERLEKSSFTIEKIKRLPNVAQPAKPLASSGEPFKKAYQKPTPGKEIMLGGIIEEIKEMLTKKGDKMVFMKIADLTGSIESVVFPKIYEDYRNILAVDNCVAIKGTVSDRNGEKSIIVDKVKLLE